MTNLIDGKAFAAGLRDNLAKSVSILKDQGKAAPKLAVVLVGEDPASQVYVRNKIKMTEAAGMISQEHKLPAETSQLALLKLIDELNKDPSVNGILVQLPVPDHLNETEITQAIDPAKDVDGLHIQNVGLLASGRRDGMIPCTPLGCLMMLKAEPIELSGAKAVVIGRSNLFGKPMAQLLLQENATPTIAHSRTQDLEAECRQADILIAAVGRAGLVKGDWIKPGATVIDVGINRLPPNAEGKSKLVGDVDFAGAQNIARAITPVPGGVGPMTIACLLHNTVTAYCRQNHIDPASINHDTIDKSAKKSPRPASAPKASL